MGFVGILARLAAAAAAFAASTPACASWRKAETANFVLYSQADEADLKRDAGQLEDYLSLLKALTGVEDKAAPEKLSVYVVKYHEGLETVRPATGSSIVGFYWATEQGVAAFAQSMRGLGEGLGQEVLFHEIAHHFMLQYRPLAYPLWYIEGFAEFVQTATFDDEKIEIGKPSRMRAGWLIYEHWLPLEKILLNKAPDTGAGESLFYAESWLLTHYLLRDEGRRARLGQYLTATAAGEEPLAAFTRAFGMDPKAMQKAMADYTKKGFGYTRLHRASGTRAAEVTVTQLPPSADDLLLIDAALKSGLDARHAAAALSKVRSAGRRSSDEFAQRVVAEAEALIGDPDAAERALLPLLAAHPNDAELLYLEGMRHLAAAARNPAAAGAERKQAQVWLAKSHRADPNRYQTLFAYAQSLVGDPEFLSENTTNVLLMAHALAPQVPGIALAAARHLMLRERFDAAAALLTPLASSPHDRANAEAARSLLALARSKTKPSGDPLQPAAQNDAPAG